MEGERTVQSLHITTHRIPTLTNRSLCYVVMFCRDVFLMKAFGVFCTTSLLTTMASPAEPLFVSSRLAFFLSSKRQHTRVFSPSSPFLFSSSPPFVDLLRCDDVFPMVVLPSVEGVARRVVAFRGTAVVVSLVEVVPLRRVASPVRARSDVFWFGVCLMTVSRTGKIP